MSSEPTYFDLRPAVRFLKQMWANLWLLFNHGATDAIDGLFYGRPAQPGCRCWDPPVMVDSTCRYHVPARRDG